MFHKKKNPDKIEAPHFAPLCAALPKPDLANRDDMLDNMKYMETELKRWNDSIAWVNDLIDTREITASLDFALIGGRSTPLFSGIMRADSASFA